MKTVSVAQFIAGLRAIPQYEFSTGIVYDYMKNHLVNRDSLDRYLFFSKSHYTRNLIFKDELFELLAICWEVGQASSIHNHYGQNCWMAIPIGKLRVRNFRILEEDTQNGYCRLELANASDVHKLLPAEVNPAEPVHQVLNLGEFNQRAVSLHVYSRPFDRCLVYARQENRCREIQLSYFSEYGTIQA